MLFCFLTYHRVMLAPATSPRTNRGGVRDHITEKEGKKKRNTNIYNNKITKDAETRGNRKQSVTVYYAHTLAITIQIIMFRFHSLKLEIFLFTEGRLRLITSGL